MAQNTKTLKDYYHTLEVSPTASSWQIKAAFRRLARRYHPDVPQTGSINKMTEINEAYDVLSNRLKRGSYDRVLHGRHFFSDEEIDSGTVVNRAFYDFEPMMVAAQEASNGKSKVQIISILVDIGLTSSAATEIVDEVFETRAELRKKTVIDTIRTGIFLLLMDAIIAGIMYAFNPATDIFTHATVGLIVIVVISSIVGAYKKITS
ncbi:J domain-containing protein [Chloroflexota bacterium]